eukprot:TRINITY_DN2259_c0_g1_i2.p1 TRINITY_DN2259_c0_g1~~TRINITY_DN2259_c0_g1_i2.p1  ORF type:complete len:237 (+),score=81.55 TRINITY_DN2259_c0_g1_i2:56-766(+)
MSTTGMGGGGMMMMMNKNNTTVIQTTDNTPWIVAVVVIFILLMLIGALLYYRRWKKKKEKKKQEQLLRQSTNYEEHNENIYIHNTNKYETNENITDGTEMSSSQRGKGGEAGEGGGPNIPPPKYNADPIPPVPSRRPAQPMGGAPPAAPIVASKYKNNANGDSGDGEDLEGKGISIKKGVPNQPPKPAAKTGFAPADNPEFEAHGAYHPFNDGKQAQPKEVQGNQFLKMIPNNTYE